MKSELGPKVMTEFTTLRLKTCSYFADRNDEDKKEKGTKKYFIKGKLKFKNYIHCLETVQFKNVDSPWENNKEFIKNNKLTSNSQQNSKTEKYNVLTEKVNKIALSANDYQRIQSIDSIEAYAYETSKKIYSVKICSRWKRRDYM